MSQPLIYQKKSIRIDMEPGKYFWCSCGKSSNQPYCDGSHKGSEFSPVMVEITEAKRVSWCACKMTGNKPFCDGTHRTL
ncbi:MAG: CDGSH iron-sulfur domain-containing protein [Ignavibacteria bacterium]|jgi:CDGSH-type Zn-finger protein